MKLTYHDHVPEDYEPPGFRAEREGGGHFSRTPFSMCEGGGRGEGEGGTLGRGGVGGIGILGRRR